MRKPRNCVVQVSDDNHPDRVCKHIRSLCLQIKERCEVCGPWEGCGKCVMKRDHRGMHFDGHGWWSDGQAAEAIARIVESVHGE